MPKVTSSITSGTSASSVPALRFTANGKPYFINTFGLQQPASLAALNQGENVLSLPQSTGVYPQIKPLMRGAEIERQLSKAGTINRNQLETYIAKQGKYYQEVMNDVLNSEFNGVTRIDYNAFRDAVQRRLPEYSRVKQSDYAAYGMDRLGFQVKKIPDGAGGILSYVDGTPINTFTFETPGIVGNTKHYKGEPIGHSRTYTTNEEPDVLHVMESQSDWAQNRFTPTVRILRDGKDVPVLSKMTQKYMRDTYTERQIQENLRYAAENGQTKMRYPTRETAAKIEGYKKIRQVSRKEYTDYVNEYRKKEERLRQKYNLPDGCLTKEELDANFEPNYFAADPNIEYNLALKEIEKFNQEDVNSFLQEKAKLQTPEEWRNSKPIGYAPEHETILKKYDAFPKQFQKIFGKNAEIRIVTDERGHTWYEVDVPKSYLDKTAEIQFRPSMDDIFTREYTQEELNRVLKATEDFYQNDVYPRMMRERGENVPPRLLQPSPYFGNAELEDNMGRIFAQTYNKPRINKEGKKYTVAFNKNDNSSFIEKVSTAIHDFRHDLQNHQGATYEVKEMYDLLNELVMRSKSNKITKAQYNEISQKIEEIKPLLDEYKSVLNGYTMDEEMMLRDSFLVSQTPIFNDSRNVREIGAFVTQIRERMSRDFGGVYMEKLDAKIREMPDKQFLEYLKNDPSYGQDYYNGVMELPVSKQHQQVNKMKETVIKVASITGIASGLSGTIIQGRNTKPE